MFLLPLREARSDTPEKGLIRLKKAEFQNVTDSVTKFGKTSCSSASISWNPQRSESRPATFVLGFKSDTPQLNSPKVWEFDQDHQRWLPVAELAEPNDKGDHVCALAWAPNIGRPYELIAVATSNGISIWQMASNPDSNGRLTAEKVDTFPCHDSEKGETGNAVDGKTSEDELTCSVCLEQVNVGELVRSLPCLHQFHASCIDPWLRQQGTCPVCKFRVGSVWQDENEEDMDVSLRV